MIRQETGCGSSCCSSETSRASFWTGRYPHETGVLSNGRQYAPREIPAGMPTLGETFARAGWETVHFGKTHGAGTLRGFVCEPENQIVSGSDNPAYPRNQDTFHDLYTVQALCRYLEKREDPRPLFLTADLVNPHNICAWIGANQGVHTGTPSALPLPPLPENFWFDDIENRPVAVRYICCSHNRQAQTAGWTPDNFRE